LTSVFGLWIAIAAVLAGAYLLGVMPPELMQVCVAMHAVLSDNPPKEQQVHAKSSWYKVCKQ
jgi:hypothetical protein